MTAESDSINVFSVIIKKTSGAVDISLNWPLAVCIVIVLFIPFLYKWIISKGTYELDEAEFGIGSQKIKFKSNYSNLQIAFKMWVELSTRKVGLLVDPEFDIISEVYDSWYSFFGVMRDLLKEIPAQTLRRDKSARDLVTIASKILNDELRPHLTAWQARYRRWYDAALDNAEFRDLTPQEIQKKYSHYSELVKDMQHVNKLLIGYRSSLEKIILSGKKFRLIK
jgi:hypothetical protein